MDRSQIISQHINKVIYAAKRFARLCPYREDDLIGVGLLTLVEVTDNLDTKMYDTNYTPFIMKHVHGALLRFIKTDTTIRIPQSTDYYIHHDPSVELDSLLSLHAYDYTILLHELWERCEKLFTKEEVKILQLIYYGYTRKEICEILNISISTLKYSIARIKKYRFVLEKDYAK